MRRPASPSDLLVRELEATLDPEERYRRATAAALELSERLQRVRAEAVLELKDELHMSYTQIGQALGISRGLAQALTEAARGQRPLVGRRPRTRPLPL